MQERGSKHEAKFVVTSAGRHLVSGLIKKLISVYNKNIIA